MPKNDAELPETPVEEAPEAESSEAAENEEDFAGYGSLEAMKAAIYASRKEGKRLADEVAALRARTSEERRSPSSRAAERSAWEQINDLGLPPELLERAIDERLERKSAPKERTDAAVASIRRANPEFTRFEAQFTDWLADNPHVSAQYASTVAAAPESAELALEGVFAQFARESAKNARKAGNGKGEKLSPDAALPNTQSGSGATRRGAPPVLTAAERRELIKAARETNDPVPLMRALGYGTRVPIHRDFAKG